MGVKTDTELLTFGIEFAKKCMEIEDEFDIDLDIWKVELRFRDVFVLLAELGCGETLENAKRHVRKVADFVEDEREATNLEDLVGDKYYDGALLCENDLYDTLYYYQGWGDCTNYGKEATKKLYDELSKVLEKYDFHLDMSRGETILLQCPESYREGAKAEEQG